MIGDPVRVELRFDSVLALNPVLFRSELVLVLSGTVLVLVLGFPDRIPKNKTVDR